ncbi:MAG: DNA polymerase III subunit delta [Paludibacteraceae bacterium]|jgi:DNA polymerase-3 subunit delta|nr:DNA polymerase III subunit delta [Paludibacteraceae bacterium]
MQKFEDVMRDVRQGKLAQVYMLCGEEPYYIDQVCDWLEEHVLDEAAKAFDQTVVYGKDLPGADISTAIGAARGFAMMGGKKVVIVKEAQHVKKWEALGQYADNPQPDTVLVVCYKYGAPDKRQQWWKKLEKSGAVVMQSDKLRDYQVERWISDYLKTLGEAHPDISFAPNIARILADSLGTDLSAIVGALQKLIDGRPEGVNVIDAALVERNIGISKDYNVFELQEALVRGDVVKANRITQYFASSKDHPMIKELGILYNFFQTLMMYHYLPDKSDRAAASALGVNPYFVKDYAAAARRYSAGKTFKIISYFRETDARLKGINNPSATDADLWKELIYKIMH